VSLLYLDYAIGIDTSYQTHSWDALLEKRVEQDHPDFYFVQTVDTHIPVPKVLLLKEFDKQPPHYVRFSRAQIFMRDEHTCQYCGDKLPKQKLNLDHVVPRVQGGKTTWDNVVTSCHDCNRRKGGRTPVQAGMPLMNPPSKPCIPPIMLAVRQRTESWDPFLAYLDQ
jgi:5-methylcytosine-specific restriction endonuclease McrA